MASTYLRLDRRSEAPDIFGKPGVSYPYGSTSYPQIVEEYSGRSVDALPSYLSNHPNGNLYPNALLSHIVPGKGDNTDKKYTLVYETFPGPPVVTYPHESTSFPKLSVRSAYPNPANIPAFSSAYPDTVNYPNAILSDVIPEKGGVAEAIYTLVYETLPGPVYTSEFYDAETDSIVTETKQEVPIGTADPTLTSLLTDFRSEPINQVKKQFVIRTYPSTVTNNVIVTYERESYTYPALMSDLEADTNYGVLDAVSGYTALFLSPTIESERIREVSKRITRTFTTTPPTAAQIMDGIYVIQPIRHQFNSPIYQFQTGPVICDAVDIIYSTGSSNPIWTAFSMNYSSSASIPSYTEYIAARTASLSSGTLQTIYNESKKLAHSLYMLTAVAIPIL